MNIHILYILKYIELEQNMRTSTTSFTKPGTESPCGAQRRSAAVGRGLQRKGPRCASRKLGPLPGLVNIQKANWKMTIEIVFF